MSKQEVFYVFIRAKGWHPDLTHMSEELDHHMANQVSRTVDTQIEKGDVRVLIFDFEGMTFMDSSGIGMVLGRNRKMEFLGGKTYVTGISPSVDRIFSMSGLYRIISKYQERNEAYEPRK